MATEQRLIYINEVEEMVGAFADQAYTKAAYAAFWKVIHNIRQMPTVDAVEVVRCRECKHFGGHGICFCHAADVDGTPIFVREDDFCSYGERKDNGKE